MNTADLFRVQLTLEGLRFDAEGYIERWRDMPGESGPPARVVAVNYGVEQAVYFGSAIDPSLEESLLALPVQALLAGAPGVLDIMERAWSVILVPQPEGGYFVECPSLPGCHSQGETVEEALANITEAIALVLEDRAEQGEPIPNDGEPIIMQVRVAG